MFAFGYNCGLENLNIHWLDLWYTCTCISNWNKPFKSFYFRDNGQHNQHYVLRNNLWNWDTKMRIWINDLWRCHPSWCLHHLPHHFPPLPQLRWHEPFLIHISWTSKKENIKPGLRNHKQNFKCRKVTYCNLKQCLKRFECQNIYQMCRYPFKIYESVSSIYSIINKEYHFGGYSFLLVYGLWASTMIIPRTCTKMIDRN